MLTIGDKQYRNLQEQVLQNQNDIQYILGQGGTLNEFGIKVVGQVNTEAELPSPATYQGEYGDAFAVGTETPYTLYIWTRAFSEEGVPFWFNIGKFPAPSMEPGPQGEQGPIGLTGQRGSIWFQGTQIPGQGITIVNPLTFDKYLKTDTGDVYQYNGSNWALIGNIRGPQGIQGLQGPQGNQGIQGPIGPQGPVGPQGQSFTIVGTLDNIDQLPTPTEANRTKGYLIGTEQPYDLYVVVGTDVLTWKNLGKVEGVVGPAGPQGPQGPQGEGMTTITINAPSTATQGTLTLEQVQTLLDTKFNYIVFNNEYFVKQDAPTADGYLVYTHVGHNTVNEFIIKCITVTISTNGWVLTSQKLGDIAIDKTPTEGSTNAVMSSGVYDEFKDLSNFINFLTSNNQLVTYSQNLSYQKVTDKEEYKVVGMFTPIYEYVIIPATHENLPVTIVGRDVFYNKPEIKNIVLPNTITLLETGAFYQCTSLTNVTIPDSVTQIDQNAFAFCTNLTKVIIGKNLVTIGAYAFGYDTNITLYDFSKCTSVPSLYSAESLGHAENCQIKVPKALYNEWINAPRWAQLAQYITAV